MFGGVFLLLFFIGIRNAFSKHFMLPTKPNGASVSEDNFGIECMKQINGSYDGDDAETRCWRIVHNFVESRLCAVRVSSFDCFVSVNRIARGMRSASHYATIVLPVCVCSVRSAISIVPFHKL